MQRVMVTGGAGFIGPHLCESLLNDGYFVTCVDNLITGSKKNIESLLSNPNFEFIEKDIINDDLDIKTDFIFNLASPASPVDFEKLSEEILRVNSLGVLKLLELTKKNNAKFLMASTSEIYGDPKINPQTENYWGNVNSFGKRSCYDESKRFSESSCFVYLNKYNIDLRIVRIFNTYGPKMKKDDGRVVSNFINWAIKNEDVRIDGNGSQTRSFCFVSDLVEGLKKAMFSDSTKGEIFNLGNPEEYTVLDLANRIIELTSSESKIIFSNEFRPDDPMQRCPDITKAERVLNWKPQISVDEGLQKTIEYYKSLTI